MFKRCILAVCLVMLLGTVTLAQDLSGNPFNDIEAIKSLPINGVKVIKTKKGTYFVSENGRFVFKGTLYDMWNGQTIKTIEDVDRVANHLDFKKIGINFNDLFTLTYGNGPKEEVFFVSPGCPHCHTVLKQMKGLEKQYTFKIIPIPILGPKSVEAARGLMCLKDYDKAVSYLIANKYDNLPKTTCDLKPLQKNLIVAQVIGIRAVPFIVKHDGSVHLGAVKDLASFLK